MKDIYDAWLIQIDITNSCINKCAHCTRAVRFFSKPYFADIQFIEKALQSLRGWKGGVGCMGGEPTLHPKFSEICLIFQKYFPKKRCGLWTCGGPKYNQYKNLIDETFGIICYNDHTTPSYHQPLLVASEEVVPDEKLRNELIDNCWLQEQWSPAITVKGAFFCEVAATLDLLFDGPGGYPIEAGWWKKSVKQFKDQREIYCKMCSIPIPMQTLPDTVEYDLVSKINADRLQHTAPHKQGKLRINNEIFTREKIITLINNCSYRKPEVYNVKNSSSTYFVLSPYYRFKTYLFSFVPFSLRKPLKHIIKKIIYLLR